MNTTDEIVSEDTTLQQSVVRRCGKCGRPKMPALLCKNCGEVVRLRWFVRRSADGYVAECIDLDIAAEGSSIDAAIAGLQDAMSGYLAVVFEGDTEGLIPRLSPLSSRLRYHLVRLKDSLRRLFFRPRTCAYEQFYKLPSPSHSRY